MKKIVLMSSRPWQHAEYLNKFCLDIDCQVEAVLCTPYINSPSSSYWSCNSIYEEMTKSLFPKATIVHHDMHEWNLQAERYIKDSNTIIIAEFEFEEDCVFQFMMTHRNASNMIYMTRYPDAISLFRETDDWKGELVIPDIYDCGNLSFLEDRNKILMNKLNL